MPESRTQGRRRSRVLWAALLAVVLVAAAGVLEHETRNVRVPLLSAAVGLDVAGQLVGVGAQAPATVFYPGTRVLREPGAAASARARGQQGWLSAGLLPGGSGPYRDLVEDALLDLRTLTLPGGAVVAGSPAGWRYVWPRDASFAAVALAASGHLDDAVDVMRFLQSVLPPSGLFQARYLPDASGVPDARGEESDATGLALWAVDELTRLAPDATARLRVVTRLRPLIDRATAAELRLTGPTGTMPPPSQDYWEVPDRRLSLGTAAPLATGLSAAARLYALAGDPAASAACERRAGQVYVLIRRAFGRAGYPRYLGDTAPDASLAYLLPPFTDAVDPG
ncbi:MAG: glycoside hydrolase family 15, partial [Kineosporiaceae bacterium]